MAEIEENKTGDGPSAKDTLREVLRDTISMAVGQGLSIQEFRGIALFNVERDEKITALGSFSDAIAKITDLPYFAERFGVEAATRVVLQFVYQYFKRADTVAYEERVFEGLYCDLVRELQVDFWLFRGVANLRFLVSDTYPVDLGDGITIRGRSDSDLASLGFDAAIWERICEDWSGFGASSFVLVVEHLVPKKPDNLILMDTYQLSVKALRAILALRLCNEGSIAIGPMWVVRASHFNVGIGGLSRIGASIPTLGNPYRWAAELGEIYSPVYDALARLEKEEYRSAPGNLSVALRAYTGTFDRWPTSLDSQLLDCITALEALLGADTEISFKLSFRVASLLARNDNERSSLLKLIKDFYDTRSKVIHGAHLRPKHQDLLQRIDELRAIVRQLLRAFIRLSDANPPEYGKGFWQEKLDGALVNAGEREKLRAALGLC
jgi:Apea-like HEPN